MIASRNEEEKTEKQKENMKIVGESEFTFTEFVEHVQRTIFSLQMSKSFRAHKSLQEINLWWLAGWLGWAD